MVFKVQNLLKETFTNSEKNLYRLFEKKKKIEKNHIKIEQLTSQRNFYKSLKKNSSNILVYQNSIWSSLIVLNELYHIDLHKNLYLNFKYKKWKLYLLTNFNIYIIDINKY